jgi:hypothetical protein
MPRSIPQENKMEKIKKGDSVAVPDASEPMVASRDEYLNRVWVMSARDYELYSAPTAPRGNEEPYLVFPDGSLMRDFQHGLPDYKG